MYIHYVPPSPKREEWGWGGDVRKIERPKDPRGEDGVEKRKRGELGGI